MRRSSRLHKTAVIATGRWRLTDIDQKCYLEIEVQYDEIVTKKAPHPNQLKRFFGFYLIENNLETITRWVFEDNLQIKTVTTNTCTGDK